jgi:methionyl-tRNA formyltransferase
MRIAFAGTPEFACPALEALHAAGHEIVLVLTQPDRPAGRGLKLRASPVKQWAQAHGVEVLQPLSLRLDGRYPDQAAAARDTLQKVAPDVMVVAAYGLILPKWTLSLPRLGCLNIHASLLPRWRGAAPIERALEAGDTQTGVTIMQMDEGLDTGAIVCMQALPILKHENAASLRERLSQLGAQLIAQALQSAVSGSLRATPQPMEGITYAHKIDKAQARIDWTCSATEIECAIRAFDPFPGAWTNLKGELIKIWSAQVDDQLWERAAHPGEILSSDGAILKVACGFSQDEQGCVLRLTQLQRAGGKRLGVREFLSGFALTAGMILE